MFLDDLAKSVRPAILVGGGAYRARHEIRIFAEQYSIPCFRTWNAQDIVTDDLPIYCGTVGTYGGPGRNFGIQNCDLLLSLGCRMSGRITGGMPETFARGAKKYIVNVDDDPTAGQVQGIEIRQTCEAFMDTIGLSEWRNVAWLRQCREWLVRYDPVKISMQEGDFHHYGFMRQLSELIPANAIIVSDTGGNVIMMGHCFKSKRGQRIFTSNGNTPMNFAMCGALGAWFADPTRPVFCIIGDGGMQGNIQELQTLKHYGVPLKVFIINNKVLGNTKSYQRVNKMAEVACGPDGYSVPDFKKVVMAYGLHAYGINNWQYVETIFNAMMADPECAVCDVVDEDRCNYEPRVSRFDAPIEEMYPPLPVNEFSRNMIIEPLEGWLERNYLDEFAINSGHAFGKQINSDVMAALKLENNGRD